MWVVVSRVSSSTWHSRIDHCRGKLKHHSNQDTGKSKIFVKSFVQRCVILSVIGWDSGWIVELGHVDICLEVSMMSSHLALPRGGHPGFYHIIAYLKKYHNAERVYDLLELDIDSSVFVKQDWTCSTMPEEERKDVILPGFPELQRKGFVICCFVEGC